MAPHSSCLPIFYSAENQNKLSTKLPLFQRFHDIWAHWVKCIIEFRKQKKVN